MGLHFGESIWLGDEVNQFTTVGRNEMAGRSGQVQSLLSLLSSTLIVFDWMLPSFDGRSEIELQISRERKTRNVT